MILVLTTEWGDYSHPAFIDWLKYYKANYFILSGEGIHNGRYDISLKENQLIIDGINFNKEISVVLNRRFLTINEIPDLYERDKKLNTGLKKRISDELYEFRNFLPFINNAYWIPDRNSTHVNKLNVLKKAMDLGINVPAYLVTNNKSDLITFKKEYAQIITKAIGNFQPVFSEQHHTVNPIYTKVVSDELIKKLSQNFALSFFQELITKKSEYRVLYFMGNFFTVELLSQENQHTSIDSRVQNDKNENLRLVKSDLPLFIKSRLKGLMDALNLNIGCIDLLKDMTNEYFFLEVNPVGQIGGYSKRANLNFEKFIVEKIIDIDNQWTKKH
ncbi:hypothetical protein ED312_11215 [Sinomicrobium pectinilyticum]|uniref:ATP-grasp domain-containing protein n=1 Tax=Sinomicrobium pectinilyticum TaxID=1084421 RepID=A0A3N0EFV5_SINP1|nr:hypothetical protein [Sinomicrobium pectinilyticum]RNL86694.1 hypothetical protein ED312_11215 [Sinomicrobium pectinilyticum]